MQDLLENSVPASKSTKEMNLQGVNHFTKSVWKISGTFKDFQDFLGVFEIFRNFFEMFGIFLGIFEFFGIFIIFLGVFEIFDGIFGKMYEDFLSDLPLVNLNKCFWDPSYLSIDFNYKITVMVMVMKETKLLK